MKLKLDGEGHAVLQDGMPVYTRDDGSEAPFDALNAVQAIAARNAEAKGHREAREKAEAQLRAFEGITDPGAARKAMETVKGLNDKQLIDAGEVEKVKSEAIKAVEAQFQPVVAERDALRGEIRSEKIGGGFARSKFIAEKVAIPADLMESRFGRFFDLKDGKVIATDPHGNQVFSKVRPGEPADFDEALEIIVDAYPYKDSILKGSGAAGTGAKASGAGGQPGGKTMTRSEFNKLPPIEQGAKMREGLRVTD